MPYNPGAAFPVTLIIGGCVALGACGFLVGPKMGCTGLIVGLVVGAVWAHAWFKR